MFNRIPQAYAFSIRPAYPTDAAAMVQLLERSFHQHFHPDWQPFVHWLGKAPAFVAEGVLGLLGFAITPANPPPAAWIRAAAVHDRADANQIMSQMLNNCLAELAKQQVSTLSAMPVEPWLPPILDELGFAIVEQVENWIKPNLETDQQGNPQVVIRPAQLEEISALAAIDQAAFAPRWWHSVETLRWAWEQAQVFTVAEQNRRPVGFQISLAHQNQAHLARVTIHPAVQRQGIATRLLADALARYAALGLEHVSLNTQTDNHASHRLYAAFDFQREGLPVAVWERPV